MNGLTNYITEWKWCDIITTWYVLVDDAYQSVVENMPYPIRSRGPAPLMSDSEVYHSQCDYRGCYRFLWWA